MNIKDVNAGYHGKTVLKSVNLEIKKGEIISLIGPNGGGKSTLLKTISGELKPLVGTVYLGGDNLNQLPLRELAKKMSIVGTQRINPEHMSAFDIVLSGRLPYSDGFGLFKDADKEAAERAADLMNLEAFLQTDFSALSDGQKQRTLIARAICQEPEVLVMDEPTSYLDIRHRFELMDVIKKLANDGITVIMSLHELELALNVSDRLILVRGNGKCTAESKEAVLEGRLLQDLFGLTDEMFEKVRNQFF